MAKIERNAPCPCGSGKKFKRCCGDEQLLTVMPAFGRAESDRALALLGDMLESLLFDDTFAAARSKFFGPAFESATRAQIQAALQNDQTLAAFNMWLIFDEYITADKHRLLDAVLSGPTRNQFTAGQVRYLERMAASSMRPYEIRDVRRDQGFVLRDLWSDAEVVVSERSATAHLARGEMFFARVIEGSRGAPELHGAVLVLMPLAMQELLPRLRASFTAKRRGRPSLDETTFFKEAGPRIGQAWISRFMFRMPELRTSDGEVLQSQELIYDILDRDSLVRALGASDEFDWNPDANQYVWLGGPSRMHGIGNTLLGSLTLEGSRMRAHVMSAERAERLRALLDRIAPDALRYRLSDISDLSNMAKRSRPDTRADDDVPPEVEAQILAEFNDRYYRAWLDEPIPALGRRTPRHAATLKTQRPKVAALIREIELRPMDQHVPDTGWMWEELGLTDLR